ncbi:MAG: cyclic nucleotide-binding domain-containing protein [Myxococcaceae bacterium]
MVKASAVGRIAIPVEEPSQRPALVPLDVWLSYQQELRQAELVVSDEDVLAMQGGFLSGEHAAGLGASITADHEIAREALGRVSLFANVKPEELDALAKLARQGSVNAHDYLFREGEDAQSFYVVLDGAVEVLRRGNGREVALRHIGRGEAIGLFGLYSGQKRAACVRAIGEASVLEIPSSAFNALVERDEDLRRRLFNVYKERLLEGFLGSSRLFTDVDSIARGMMIARFKERFLEGGQVLVHPGEVCNLMAVLVSGKLLLEEKSKSGQVATVYELLPGQFVALTSAFLGMPSRMKIHASEASTLLLLSQREWSELTRDYPALRSLSARLQAYANGLARDVFCGHTGVPGL